MKIYPYITDSSGNIPITLNLYSHDEPKHMHDYIELVYVFSGSGMHYVNDIPYHLSRGSLLFIDFGQVHEYTCLDNMSYVNFKLRPEYFSDSLKGKTSIKDIFSLAEFQKLPKNENSRMAHFEGHLCLRIEQLIFSILEENLTRAPGFKNIIKNSLRNLLIQLKRNLINENEFSHETAVPERLRAALDYINEHCGEKITLKKASDICSYSEVYFSRLLKTYFGCGFSEYLMKRRINKAMNLLIETDISIQEISIISGFNNKTHFYRTFKKYIGVKPSFIRVYRQNFTNYVHSAINKSINAFYEYDVEAPIDD